MINTHIHEPQERPQLIYIIRGGCEEDSAQYLILGLQNCAVGSGCSSFFDYDDRDTAGQNTEENRGAAALPGQRMMALGPGGVVSARGWSISLRGTRGHQAQVRARKGEP
eukprot:scaffold2426_cov65-Cyclotella_meneghiniana.AAC.2